MNYLRASDKTCHRFASIQKRIFSRAYKDNLPCAYFIRAFLSLNETKTMDDLSFDDGWLSEQDLYCLAKQRLHKQNSKPSLSLAAMEWIGYFYRGFSYITGIESRRLLSLLPFHYLKSVYPLYHSLDILSAVNKVCIDRDIEILDDEERLKRIIRDSYQNTDPSRFTVGES